MVSLDREYKNKDGLGCEERGPESSSEMCFPGDNRVQPVQTER